MLMGAQPNGRAIKAVNNLLNFDRVTVSTLNLRGVGEGDVLETMDLTKAPEHGITILTGTLDLEHLAEIKLLKSGKSELVNHLILGEGLSRVHGKVVSDVIAGVKVLEGLEEAELAYDVLRRGVVRVGHTLKLRAGELREHTTWQLHTSIEGAHKSS